MVPVGWVPVGVDDGYSRCLEALQIMIRRHGTLVPTSEVLVFSDHYTS